MCNWAPEDKIHCFLAEFSVRGWSSQRIVVWDAASEEEPAAVKSRQKRHQREEVSPHFLYCVKGREEDLSSSIGIIGGCKRDDGASGEQAVV